MSRSKTKSDRRLFLSGVLLTAIIVSAAQAKQSHPGTDGGNYAAFHKPLKQSERFNHALDRLTFGPEPGDLQSLKQTGIDRWIREQTHPGKLPDDAALDSRLKSYQILRMSISEIYAQYPPRKMGTAIPAETENRNATCDSRRKLTAGSSRNIITTDLAEGKLLRAIYSKQQLQELLVDFWFNHFNVFIGKGNERYLLPTYEREAIRPNVFGKFYDLLLATAKSPAMLVYLDNAQSVGPLTPGKRKRGLNENYGRELLELHTLGVNGGYTQKDVIEVARCFTGWTVKPLGEGGEFRFNKKTHDEGEKLVLGHINPPGGGMSDGLKVLDILAHHPATAQFISLKLAQRFVADDPPPSLVNRMAKTFSRSDGNLRAVMRTMLKSPEFWSQGAYRAKVKTPLELVASAIRATKADVSSLDVLAKTVQNLGESLYKKVEPTGYSSANKEWVSSAGLLGRMNFALALTQDRVKGVSTSDFFSQSEIPNDSTALADMLLQRKPDEQTLAAIDRILTSSEGQEELKSNSQAGQHQLRSLIAGLVIGSPEFQRH